MPDRICCGKALQGHPRLIFAPSSVDIIQKGFLPSALLTLLSTMRLFYLLTINVSCLRRIRVISMIEWWGRTEYQMDGYFFRNATHVAVKFYGPCKACSILTKFKGNACLPKAEANVTNWQLATDRKMGSSSLKDNDAVGNYNTISLYLAELAFEKRTAKLLLTRPQVTHIL